MKRGLLCLTVLMICGCQALVARALPLAPVAVADAVATVRAEVPDLPNAFAKNPGTSQAAPRPYVEAYVPGSRCRPCNEAMAALSSAALPFEVRWINVGPNGAAHGIPRHSTYPVFKVPSKTGQWKWVWSNPGEALPAAAKLQQSFKDLN